MHVRSSVNYLGEGRTRIEHSTYAINQFILNYRKLPSIEDGGQTGRVTALIRLLGFWFYFFLIRFWAVR